MAPPKHRPYKTHLRSIARLRRYPNVGLSLAAGAAPIPDRPVAITVPPPGRRGGRRAGQRVLAHSSQTLDLWCDTLAPSFDVMRDTVEAFAVIDADGAGPMVQRDCHTLVWRAPRPTRGEVRID